MHPRVFRKLLYVEIVSLHILKEPWRTYCGRIVAPTPDVLDRVPAGSSRICESCKDSYLAARRRIGDKSGGFDTLKSA